MRVLPLSAMQRSEDSESDTHPRSLTVKLFWRERLGSTRRPPLTVCRYPMTPERCRHSEDSGPRVCRAADSGRCRSTFPLHWPPGRGFPPVCRCLPAAAAYRLRSKAFPEWYAGSDRHRIQGRRFYGPAFWLGGCHLLFMPRGYRWPSIDKLLTCPRVVRSTR